MLKPTNIREYILGHWLKIIELQKWMVEQRLICGWVQNLYTL